MRTSNGVPIHARRLSRGNVLWRKDVFCEDVPSEGRVDLPGFFRERRDFPLDDAQRILKRDDRVRRFPMSGRCRRGGVMRECACATGLRRLVVMSMITAATMLMPMMMVMMMMMM